MTAVLSLGALASAAASAPATLDELIALNQRAWSGEPELVSQAYAPDAVHTATFYDRTNEYVGPQRIAMVAGLGVPSQPIGPRIDLPAPEGEWRWVDFISLGGGAACLMHAVDGQIVRHDCLVSEHSYEIRPAAQVTEDLDTLAAIDEIQGRLDAAWGSGTSVEALEAVYTPDAVHSARYLDETRAYVGPQEIMQVAGLGIGMEQVGPLVAFTAPEDELAWAQVVDLAGGSVCLFRARDGMVFRHDCLLPITGASIAPESPNP
jgi:hypothetical protein